MLTGRGVMLIAGFNTMSPEARARYNAPRLARAVGTMLLFVVASLVLGALYFFFWQNAWLLGVSVGLLILTPILFILYFLIFRRVFLL